MKKILITGLMSFSLMFYAHAQEVIQGDLDIKGDISASGKLMLRKNSSGVGDIISLYADRFNATNMYGFGIESTGGILYSKAVSGYNWYINTNADNGVSSLMSLKSNGHLGLGTQNPLSIFTIESSNGNIPALGASGHDFGISIAGARGLMMGHLSNGHSYIQSQRIDGTATAYNLLLQPNGGRVGIGVKYPSERLHVSGSVQIHGNVKLSKYAYQAFKVGNTKGYIWGNHDYEGNSGVFQDDLVISTNWHGVTNNEDNITNSSSFLRNSAISVGRHGIRFFTSATSTAAPTEKMTISDSGNVGIGTSKTSNHKLAVEGSIGAREIQVEVGAWSDFVFDKDYSLRKLDDLERYIQTNNHLPDIPSEKEVQENGINLGESDAKLLQKIEELTLYTIQQQKQLNKQTKLIEQLKKEVEELKNNAD